LYRRGDITVWLSDDAISHWYKADRTYDGSGAPKLYTDFAIITPDHDIHAIAIDSTGLKRFGRGEWHREKYELSSKASWRKLHLAIN